MTEGPSRPMSDPDNPDTPVLKIGGYLSASPQWVAEHLAEPLGALADAWRDAESPDTPVSECQKQTDVHQCSTCGQQFGAASRLARHIEEDHPEGLDGYKLLAKCPSCLGEGVEYLADDDDIGDACPVCDGTGLVYR